MTLRKGGTDENQELGHNGECLLSLTIQKRNKGNHLSFICLLHSLRDFDTLFSKFSPLIISDSFSQ